MILGKAQVSDFFVLNQPSVEVLHHNGFGQLRQHILMDNDQNAIVTELLYDPLGRESIRTKPTRVNTQRSLFKMHKNFIKSFNPQNGKIEGIVNDLNLSSEGYPYMRIVYHKNPLHMKKISGLAGKDFNVDGRFALRYNESTKIPFINNYFKGYKQKVEKLANGSQRILIFDQNENKIARYIRVPGFNHILSTYEYDSDNRMVKILSPAYHEAVKTFQKTGEFYQNGNEVLSENEKELQDKLGTHFKYDNHGNVVEKKTSDTGIEKITIFSIITI